MSSLIKPQTNFTTIPNHIINDDRLSLKAKGLFLYLCSKPDGWDFSADRIKNESKDGEDSILSALKELEKFGLLTRVRVRVKGVLKGNDYALSYDILPKPENPVLVKPKREKPAQVKPVLENPVSNKEVLKKEILERENLTYDDFSEFDQFLDYLCSFGGIKNIPAYRAKIKISFLDRTNKSFAKTNHAFIDWKKNNSPACSSSLPIGLNIFDLIGRD